MTGKPLPASLTNIIMNAHFDLNARFVVARLRMFRALAPILDSPERESAVSVRHETPSGSCPFCLTHPCALDRGFGSDPFQGERPARSWIR